MSAVITVTVAETRGSAPRNAGTSMRIWADGQNGTIGGGALEWEATRLARQMLREGCGHMRRVLPLGPNIGQCCGGSVTLEFQAKADVDAPKGAPLWIWGAGHVGRAVVHTLAPLPDFTLTWVDTSTERFPARLPETVTKLVATEPARAVTYAPTDARHLILTYSHDIDLQLCDALLRHGFDWAGLIGSRTKWARFCTKLTALGHSHDQINRITCPIGEKDLGKHPQAIAVGVAAALLRMAVPAKTHAQTEASGDR